MAAKKRSEMAIKHEFKSYRDITPMHVSLGNMLYNKTGSWRFIKPIYEDKIPACQNACPAGNDIEGWIKLLNNKDFEKAYWHLKREEPFPAILGRVCFKFCEDACNRAVLDDCISIKELERFIGDQFTPATPHPELPDTNGQSHKIGRLAVVGSGPSGMSVAYFARLLGFEVTIFDKEKLLGGILRLGIPGYRLPRQVVAAEFEGLSNMGIELRPDTEIGKDIPLEALTTSYDYVFLATGAHRSIPTELMEKNISCCQIMSGLTFLKQVARGEKVVLGKRVVVIGGGNTAIDAARTAIRLGCHATVIYRRSMTEMPAHPEEVKEAEEEGVNFRFLATPEDIALNADATIGKLVCCEMELGPADESGRCRPIRKEGVTFDMPADTILIAIGEKPDFDYLGRLIPSTNSFIATGEDLSVSYPPQGAKVFAGGDMIDIPHTVVHAVAAGKRAAIAMDCDRRGVLFSDVLNQIRIGSGDALSFSSYVKWAPVNLVNRNDQKVVDSTKIVYDYFIKSPGCKKTIQPAELRKDSFEPYHTTLSEEAAIHETERCMHCGRCTECDNCLIFCPDVSILDQTRESFGYAIDYDYCKGCGICFTECPRHAITMVSES
ncbi:MAG: FAD-dependent oxidoreductase [Deltaproteobacteria bacterium]|nr:FAD-dependent oxidoreductase [Deltaproteobacteria bacterium]